ncbi:unnamed protein product [Rotaria sp. Silwood1]|nr:unnamed protein product [Rotaria sp. Silwood1]CAF1635274.1 unnamed protein product [Rotaria sp. Silwood1]CAF3794923.1 unnamed protein product [Rotaria sp. Silwood1]CAF3831429.1 unnamed protein product [Rotaria sp. Silwood1]CAF3879105.1 unnamed protein product [Rotaria sp. Silwood1]
MNTNFTWSTTEKGEKAILYENYLYRLKRENQNGSLIFVCTSKWCHCAITVKNDLIIKSKAGNRNHDPKLPENVQRVLCGLKRRILTDIDQPVTKIYEEEVKKFSRGNGTAGPIPVFGAWKTTLYSIRKTILPPTPT